MVRPPVARVLSILLSATPHVRAFLPAGYAFLRPFLPGAAKSASFSDSDASPASTLRRPLHPPAEVLSEGHLEVSDGHAIFYQIRGRPHGTSAPPLPLALFLHGGPGAGCFPDHARFFDPARWRVCLVDQRGCGRSAYPGDDPCVDNDTDRLVDDLEVLRRHVTGGDGDGAPWDCVLGGSWGCALALAYGRAHRDALRSIVLRGVCAMRPGEIGWLFSPRGGAAALAPKGYDEFRRHVFPDDGDGEEAEGERAVLEAYYQKFRSGDAATRDAAARAWSKWEMGVSSTTGRYGVAAFAKGDWSYAYSPQLLNRTRTDAANNTTAAGVGSNATAANATAATAADATATNATATNATASGRNDTAHNAVARNGTARVPAQQMLTCHYSVHDAFSLSSDPLLPSVGKALAHVPCVAVQGTADTICPPVTAYTLHRSWPEMELVLVSGGGHSQYDPDVRHELLRATDGMHDRLFGEGGRSEGS